MSARSGEMNELKIVFVYDRFSCRREEDDPKDSILYFHPGSISVEKRIAICGQLMGVSHFFTDTLSSPRIMTLANGKFALRPFDEKYVLVIGCSSITSDFLLEKEADILMSVIKFFHSDIKAILHNSNFDRGLVATKLTSMMDHYIPVSQQHGDLFSLTFGILPILHLPKSANNISLQASVLLQTCMLKAGILGGIVMYQNKVVGVELGQSLAQKLAFTQPYRMPPADLVKLDFKLPVGVQIFRVYINEAEFQDLHRDSSRFQKPETYRRDSKKATKDKKFSARKNRIAEELSFAELSTKCGSGYSDLSSGIHSDETGREFHGFNSFQNDQVSSHGSSTSHLIGNMNGYKVKPRRCQSVVDLHFDMDFGSNLADSSSTNNSSLVSKKLGTSLADPTFPYFTSDGRHSVSSAFYNPQSAESADDEDIRVRKAQICSNHHHAHQISQEPAASTPFNTKMEVSVPIQRPIDLPLSQHKLSGPQRIKKKLWATFNDLISPVDSTEPPLLIGVENGSSKTQESERVQNTVNSQMENKPTIKIPESIHLRLLNSFRRLSSHDEVLDEGGDGDGEYSSSYSASNSICSETENIQVTSASSCFSQNSSLISPFKIPTTSNLKFNKGQFFSRKVKVKKHKDSNKEKSEKSEVPRKEVALYIYYDGSMRLLMLLDKEIETNQDLIESITAYASSSLVQLKTSLSTVEEQSSFSHQSDPYCFLRYESVWKSMAHGGRNESMDFNTVQIMHRDFTRNPNINELIIRGDDHVVYGYQCVGSEVYYQQRAGLQPGLPMPSDLMGKVPLKAKRRLERDHSIVLL